MSLNLYTQVIINSDNTYRIEEVYTKPHKHFAKETLSNIQTVIKKGLSYSSTETDEWSKMTDAQRTTELKNRVFTIRDGYLSKTSGIGKIKRFFFGVSKKEAEISLLAKELAPQPFSTVPNEIMDKIMSQLGTADLARAACVDKKFQDTIERPLFRKAQKYGYKGKSFKGAQKYLNNLFKSVSQFAKSNQCPKRYVVYKKGRRGEVDPEQTLQKMMRKKKHLSAALGSYISSTLIGGSSKERALLPWLIYASSSIMHINIQDQTAWGKDNLIGIAICFNQYSAAIQLAKAGINPNHSNDLKQTPLHLVAKQGGTAEVVEELIKAGAEVNKVDKDGKTALHYAAKKGRYDIVKALIKGNANLNIKDKNGCTPLHYAASVFHTSKPISALTQAKANLNIKDNRGRTPLHWAATHHRPDNGEALIKAGADLTIKDRGGRTPLQIGFGSS